MEATRELTRLCLLNGCKAAHSSRYITMLRSDYDALGLKTVDVGPRDEAGEISKNLTRRKRAELVNASATSGKFITLKRLELLQELEGLSFED